MSNQKTGSVVAPAQDFCDPGAGISADLTRSQVLNHLNDILQSPIFRNSKRYCALLRYVVEQALEGQADQLKERTIGVEAFGRTPDYDTNADHSVRSAASEVRRRLALYYLEFGTGSGIRIDLLAGSYVPLIRVAEAVAVGSDSVLPAHVAKAETDELPASSSAASRLRRIALPLALAAVLIFGLTLRSTLLPKTSFERLWSPILMSPNPALLCVGGGGAAVPAEPPATLSDYERSPARRMNLSDAMAFAGLTGTLETNHKQFRILSRANATSYKDLQQGPFILIGGMNNEWTLRLTGNLRFYFDRQTTGARVVDRKNPGSSAWAFHFDTPFTQPTRDYAIVTRLRDSPTEQAGLIVAGIGGWGTQAAGEFVSNPAHLAKLDSLIAPGWERKNLQVVIGTDVIRGSSGPPIVLATYVW